MLRLTITTPAGRAKVESNKTELLIGRREGSDLQLEDPGASRNHCDLRACAAGAGTAGFGRQDLDGRQLGR